ncbi:MAG: PGPGW domain-containing protein [Nocardioidaceae bacterium]
MSDTPAANRTEQAPSLGGSRPVERGSFRDRVRRKPGIGHLWRVGIFLLGLLCIAAGLTLVVLPGPLTIPPIVLGLWIWSTEFEWAHRLFARGREKGAEAWAHAKRHPVSSTVVTVGGLVGAGVLVWASLHYDLVDRGKELVGLS